mmetsp:Transcript_75870/g.190927  ORF Transcript_75870/g.190927 Transcript_75870/m.190927 type:complete len:528 (+) Transcript_75870:1622-3205(+)
MHNAAVRPPTPPPAMATRNLRPGCGKPSVTTPAAASLLAAAGLAILRCCRDLLWCERRTALEPAADATAAAAAAATPAPPLANNVGCALAAAEACTAAGKPPAPGSNCAASCCCNAGVLPPVPPPAETEEKNPFCVLVCGGGNAAQVATAMFAARFQTIAVSFFADEAARWKAALGDDDYELTLDTDKIVKSKPDDITNDPSVAAKADAIVLAVPSFAHGEYFEKFAPYMKPNTVVACMPARSGGDILFASKLGDKAKDMVFMGFETLPWACRFTEWGKKATILGTKGSILAAVTPPAKTPKAFSVLQGLLGVFPNCTYSPNNLGVSLRNPGAVIHPGVMYGRWCPEKWDGNPVDEKPLFYQGVDDYTEKVLVGMTDEVQAICRRMEKLVPGLSLKDACTLKQWYLDCYDGQMTDTSTLKGCMNTNKAYNGLTHPCLGEPGNFMPDLKYRYLAEDVPTGLCFSKGLAEILGIPTPTIDKVMLWAQECIGLEIMVDGKMQGKDVGKTRAPQGMGITTTEQFIELAKLK